MKIISSDLDITKHMDISYIACNVPYKSSQHLFLLSATHYHVAHTPVVWSRSSYVFVSNHLWHSENKYLAKLHHNLHLSESCEDIKHLIKVVHLLQGLSEMVL